MAISRTSAAANDVCGTVFAAANDGEDDHAAANDGIATATPTADIVGIGALHPTADL